MKTINLPKITFWRAIATIIVITGVYSTYLRFTGGLQSATNLSDTYPWGLWIGFDILCGVGLAAGGFTLCAVTHIFNIEKFKPLTRPAILTAFLGYLLVVFGLMYDLGKPYNIWHAIIMWNPRSVMFEVAWCVMLYTTVLFLEFLPMALEKFKWAKLLSIIRKVSIPIMVVGILLSTLHQSSLGSLFLIIPTKMSAIWYSPYLPVYFFLSAVGVGFAMVIFESFLSARAFGRELEMDLLSLAGLISVSVLMFGFLLKLADLIVSGNFSLLLSIDEKSLLFFLEVLIGVLIPFGLLIQKKVRENKKWLYIATVLIVAGFIFNRMNVTITSVTLEAGIKYFPSVNEISITLMLVVLGMWAFRLITKFFPVFQPMTIKH
jgi:Ni/Fe-hydrogenase subunit HybB-like protein